MKTAISFFAALALVLSMTACGGGDATEGETKCINGILYDETGTPAVAAHSSGEVRQVLSC
jgi:hypothetical protein